MGAVHCFVYQNGHSNILVVRCGQAYLGHTPALSDAVYDEAA